MSISRQKQAYCVLLHGTISHAASVVLILKAARYLNV